METLNKVQLIGRLMKTSKLIRMNNNKWIYAWIDTNIKEHETKAIKIRAFENQAELLNNYYMIGATLYIEGKLAYRNDITEIHAQIISIIHTSSQKQDKKNAFASLHN